MKDSLKGHPLPESEADYNELAIRGELKFKQCCFGNHPHLGRTHTALGWAETQITGSCEDCFDAMFAEDDK